MAKIKETALLEVREIEMRTFRANLLGTSPMIMNRFSQKAWQELLFPSERRSRATMEQTLKHDPIAEFRGAIYRCRDEKAPTLVHVPNGAFHGALAAAAIDIPGAARAKIERLTKVIDVTVHLYGVPQMFMAMVRNSDMNHTPDVRTRPIFPEWACSIEVQYIKTVLTERTLMHLLGAAGKIVGIGDWRGQKGGPYGAFDIVGDDNATFKRIVKNQAKVAQRKAYEDPAAFDPDTEELFAWFQAELSKREKEAPSAKPRTRKTFVEDKLDGSLVDMLTN